MLAVLGLMLPNTGGLAQKVRTLCAAATSHRNG